MVLPVGQPPMQAIIVPGKSRSSKTDAFPLVLLKADGTPYSPLLATKAAAQVDSTATDVAGLKTDFNGLLAKLRTAGLLT